MGNVDPESVSAANCGGGQASTVTVKFTGFLNPLQQMNVTYTGDTEALAPNPPTKCPNPACPQGICETTFQLETVAVTTARTVTVQVHGPTKVKQGSFTVSP